MRPIRDIFVVNNRLATNMAYENQTSEGYQINKALYHFQVGYIYLTITKSQITLKGQVNDTVSM